MDEFRIIRIIDVGCLVAAMIGTVLLIEIALRLAGKVKRTIRKYRGFFIGWGLSGKAIGRALNMK